MDFHVNSVVTDLLSDPLGTVVQDAKWRVTTLMQRMDKLQAELDQAREEEKRVMAVAKKFVRTGKVPDDFFPDLSKITQRIRKLNSEELALGYRDAIQAGKLTEAEQIEEALEAGGVTGWRVREANTDGYFHSITLRKRADQQGLPRVMANSIRAALRESVEAYHTVWERGTKPRGQKATKRKAEACARAALKVYYKFDGSDVPADLDGDLYDQSEFKKLVEFNHRDYELPSRPRGQHPFPFQIPKLASGGKNQPVRAPPH